MKIDLVYLWVDGSDKKWLAKKNKTLVAMGRPVSKSAMSDRRWDDNDELMYSLRSVEKFIPWVNHIYIVTDNQIPKWLNTKNPKITIVDHSDIVPKEHLPLFNSSALELFLQNIPGLSEHFLFANDDFFFNAPLAADFFFDNKNNPIVISKERSSRAAFEYAEPAFEKHGLVKRMIRNAAIFVYKHFGKKYNLTLKHAIEPMRKSYLAENANQFYDEFVSTTATPFREASNIQRIVFPMMDNIKGRNTIVLNWGYKGRRIKYDITRDSILRRVWHRIMWSVCTIFGNIRYDQFDKQSNILHYIKKYNPAMFCINDMSDKNVKDIHDFLNENYSKKSGFEK